MEPDVVSGTSISNPPAGALIGTVICEVVEVFLVEDDFSLVAVVEVAEPVVLVAPVPSTTEEPALLLAGVVELAGSALPTRESKAGRNEGHGHAEVDAER